MLRTLGTGRNPANREVDPKIENDPFAFLHRRKFMQVKIRLDNLEA